MTVAVLSTEAGAAAVGRLAFWPPRLRPGEPSRRGWRSNTRRFGPPPRRSTDLGRRRPRRLTRSWTRAPSTCPPAANGTVQVSVAGGTAAVATEVTRVGGRVLASTNGQNSVVYPRLPSDRCPMPPASARSRPSSKRFVDSAPAPGGVAGCGRDPVLPCGTPPTRTAAESRSQSLTMDSPVSRPRSPPGTCRPTPRVINCRLRRLPTIAPSVERIAARHRGRRDRQPDGTVGSASALLHLRRRRLLRRPRDRSSPPASRS